MVWRDVRAGDVGVESTVEQMLAMVLLMASLRAQWNVMMWAILRFGKENGRLLLNTDAQYSWLGPSWTESLRGVSQYTGLSDPRTSS